MRLWHYKIIDMLPDSQLVAQWRELNSIYKKQDKHILINYIYEYDKAELYAYSMLVTTEMRERGYNINFNNFNNYFADVDVKKVFAIGEPFKKHHNKRYLLQCFFNLQEKYDRGQWEKDFSYTHYHALRWRIAEELRVDLNDTCYYLNLDD